MYERVRLGMPLNEVRACLGAPGVDLGAEGRHRNRVVANIVCEGEWGHLPADNEPGSRFRWDGTNSSIMIRLDEKGRVTDRMLIELEPETLFMRVLNFIW